MRKNKKVINPLGRKEVKNCALRWTKKIYKNRFVYLLDPDPIEPHPRKILPRNEKKERDLTKQISISANKGEGEETNEMKRKPFV